MNVFALTSLLVSVVALFLGNFVFYRNPRNVLNRVFLLYCLSAAYLAFAEFGCRQADNFDTAYLWLKISALWPFAISLLLHFALVFTEKSKLLENKLTYFLVYAPALTFCLLDLTTNLITGGPIKVYWGWTYGVPENTLMLLITIWAVGMPLLSMYLCLRYYLKTTDHKKKQAKYVLIGNSIPVAIGVTEGLLPYLEIRTPEFTTVGFVLGSIFLGHAIWKYKLFALTPATAAESIISTMADALLLVSPDGKIVTVNQAMSKLLGYEESELIDQPVEIIFARDEKARFKETWLEQLVTTGSISGIETTFETKDARKSPISLSGSVMRDEYGTERGIIYVGRDITERMRAEEELRKAHDELEIRVQERTAELSKANEALRAEITERKQAEEALQESNRRLEEVLVELRRHAEELLALQEITTSIQSSLDLNEILQQAADGIVKGLEYNSAYIMLLDEDEEFFKGAVFSTKSGIAEKIEKVIGFSLTELRIPARRDYNEATGNILDGQITIKHHLHEMVIPPLNKVACFTLQRFLNTKTIITAPLFVTGVETPAYKKVIGGLLATTQREEVTEKEIESLLVFARGIGIAIENARLYKQQKDISEELQKSYALLDEKNKELESFVYTVSHDLKAPLVSLEGFASILLDNYKESSDETGQLYLSRIQANVEKMGNLIQDLLELSRIGRIVHDYESVDVTEIIKEAVETLEIQLSERGTEWVVQEDLPTITCDRVRIKQVFENLIDNANKFMGEENDKPKIEIGFDTQVSGSRFGATQPRGFHVENLPILGIPQSGTDADGEKEDFFEFFVKDNGIGIQKEYHEKVFDLFARLGDVEVEGTGVGLAIVKKIVETHGGKIWLDSEVGNLSGTTVYFTLPKSSSRFSSG